MKHQAKKRFGQNFLVDQAIINSLVDAINPQEDQTIIEIGPGLGALTKPLLNNITALHVVEIDRDIIDWMNVEYKMPSYEENTLTIHNVDALKFDFSSLGNDLRITGNLPYNISTPILFHLLDNLASLHMEYLITVPPEAFQPAPKVESAFVRCVPHATLPFVAKDTALFAKVVLAAFSQRRKTIRNTLKPFINDDDFEKLGIDSKRRAETLSLGEFVTITNYL